MIEKIVPTIYKGESIYKTGGGGGGGGGDLPDNIKQALYLEVVAGSGSSEIPFPVGKSVSYNSDDKLEFLFSTNNLDSSCDTIFFNGIDNTRFRLYTSQPKKLQVFFNSQQATTKSLSNNTSYRVEVDAGIYRLNGTGVYNFYPVNQTIEGNIITMGGPSDVGNRFYIAELKDRLGNLKMRLIPALNTSNSKVCLYEAVQGIICYPIANEGNWGLGALIPS